MKHPLRDNGIVTPGPGRMARLSLTVVAFSAIVLLVILMVATVTWVVQSVIMNAGLEPRPAYYTGTTAVAKFDDGVHVMGDIELLSYGDEVTFAQGGKTWTVPNTDIVVMQDAAVSPEYAERHAPEEVVIRFDEHNTLEPIDVYEICQQPHG